MECGPPLNLTTTVKVEELKALVPEDVEPRDFTVEGELIEESAEKNQDAYSDDDAQENSDDDAQENGEHRLSLDEKDGETSLPHNESLSPKNPIYGAEKSYKCPECSLCYSRASQLRAHERTHFEEQVYECDQCEMVFSRIGLLMSHRREQHRQSFFCNMCDAKFSHYNSFRLHLRRHKGDKPFKCTDCHMSFVQVCHLHIHRRVHTGEKPFTCDVCSRSFKQVSHLTTHMRLHTNDRPFKCDICNISFSQTSSLTRHKRRHTGEKPFKCETCGALFVERRNLSRHILTHTGEKPFKCDKCDSCFTQMIDLKRHDMSHSGLKPFKCNVCEAAFSRKNNLRWHMLTHEGDTPYKCEKCNAGFSLMRDLKTHMRTHVDIKPYSCDQCEATFSQPSTLKRHKLSHSGERLYSCTQCKRSFKEKSALKRHSLRHGGVKPYSCEKCHSNFMEFRNLKRHKVTVHGEERFEGPHVLMDHQDGENEQNVHPPKKRPIDKSEADPLVEIYDTNFHTAQSATQQTDCSQPHASHSEPLSVANPLPQPQPPQPEVATTLPSHQQLPEIVTIPQAPGQMPTLLLTQPGQPPKPARPANSCQNHHSHVVTYVEGNFNQWQSWCFCDTPNIPDSSQTLIDSSGSVVHQVPTTSVPVVCAPPQPQHQQQQQPQITYAEVQQPPPPQPHQTVGVQEVGPAEYQVSQYNGGYGDTIHHYEDASQPDSMTSSSHHQQQQINQQNSANSLDEQRLFPMANMQQHPEQEQQQQLQQTAVHQQEQHQQQQYEAQHQHVQQLDSQQQQQQQQQHHHHQSEPVPLQQQQQQQQQPQPQPQLVAAPPTTQHQLPPHPEMEANRQDVSQPVDPQVTFQYSLTVNNPATGDIQIQSEAFPANPSEQQQQQQQPVEQPMKKRRNMKSLAKQHRVNQVFRCNDCDKTFSRLNHLLIHLRTHTGEKPFQCGVCLQSFTHKNSLTIHMRGHTGERPYSCSTCNTSFTQKSNLRVHMRTHTGEKPFKCNMCKVSFTQGSHLTAHKRIHNNERPFACESCTQTFTQRSALKRHNMTHTGNKPHKCEACGAKFSQKDDLRRHLKTHDIDSTKDATSTAVKRQKSQDGDSNKPKRQKTQECDANKPKQKAQEDETNNPKQQKIQECNTKKLFCCIEKDCSSSFNDRYSLTRHMRTVHGLKDELSKKESKKKKKPVSDDGPPKLLVKNIKVKDDEDVAEPPVRTSRRIREAAEKKKIKEENSDFIMGDFVDMVDDELVKSQIKNKPLKKLKLQDSKVVTKDKMESWCFCEVPHGPDEPHTHISIDSKVQAEQLSSIPESELHEVASQQEVSNVIASADASGATSLLQLSMEHVQHNPATTVITEGFQPQPVTFDASSIVAAPQVVNNGISIAATSEHDNQVITTVGHADPTVTESSVNNQISTTVTHPGLPNQAGGRIVGQPVLAAGQVVSAGQLVNASQIVTPDGAIYIEAGEMLSNGAVVINPGQGTFISYEQITITSDGQVLGIPGTGTDTLMLQPAVPSVDSATPTGTVTYTTGTQVTEPSASQPVQYTALGGDVLGLFSQVEQGKDTVPADPIAPEKCVVFKPVECSVCAKTFAEKRTLCSHMRFAHPLLYTCFECCAAFTTEEYLTHHKAQHQKLHVCGRCGMAFTSKTSLNRHRQQVHVSNPPPINEKEKGFACEICRTKFHQQSDLKRHMLGHTGEKPIRCKNCDAGFTRTSSLNKHMRIHTGEKPYVCSVCDQAFVYRYQINRHKIIHKQPQQPQENPDCNSGYYSMPQVLE